MISTFRRALIIGEDSMIGSALKPLLLRFGWKVYSTARRKNSSNYLDLLKPSSFEFNSTVDVVFICAAMTNLKECSEKPDISKKINFDAPVFLTRKFQSQGAQVIFLSSSAVFDGSVPNRGLADPCCPITSYGEHKAAAERFLLEMFSSVAVVRLTKVISTDFHLLKNWSSCLRLNEIIEPYFDLYLCPIAIKHVLYCLYLIALNKLTGIFHLSGEKDLSYFNLAQLLAKKMGKESSLIRPVSCFTRGVSKNNAPRFTSLNMSKSRELFGLKDMGLGFMLNYFGGEMHEMFSV